MAGVTAANELHAQGIGVSLLEASDRLGGRIHTVRDDNGVAVELGAQWIHGRRGNPLSAKASALHIQLVEDPDLSDYSDEFWAGMLTSDGSEIDRSALLKAVHSYEKYQVDLWTKGKLPWGGVDKVESLGKFLEQRFASEYSNADPALRFGFEVRKKLDCNVTACADLGEVSATQFFVGELFDGKDSLIPGGVDQLIASAVPPDFGQEVVGIRWGRDGVRVTTRSGGVFEGDYAVVALPLSILQKHVGSLFEPPVPKDKAQAVDAVGFGLLDKIILNVDPKVEWASRTIICGDEAPKWMRRNVIYTEKEGTVFMVLSGDQALQMEALSEETVREDILAVLVRSGTTNGTLPTVQSMWRSKWASNPLSLGSYSFQGVRTTGDTRSKIQAPLVDEGGVPRVFFAGEACHPKMYSTMTGAFVTGMEAAKKIEEAIFGAGSGPFRMFRKR